MIETKIPKDIRSYKTKVIGPLSFRQLICSIIAIIVDAVLWFGIFSNAGVSLKATLFILIIIDTLIFAFSFDMNGMHMEVYLKEIITKNFIYPAKRRAITDLRNEKPLMTEQEWKKHDKLLQKKFKENPEFRPYK